jgi:hypothetical protein
MNDQDQLQRQVARELREQAEQLSPAHFGLEAVKGRAGRIRRNRRIAAGVAVAAGIAVVVPTAMSVGGALRTDDGIDPAPDPTPTHVAHTTLTLDGLQRGDDPQIEYFTPDGVVLPGRGLRPLDASYQALVPSEADGGWIAMEPDGQGIRYFTEDFEPQGGSSATQSFVTTPDRAWVAWVTPEPGAQTLVLHSTTDSDRGMVRDLPELQVAVPVGFVAEDRVVFETTDQRGTTEVFVAEPDGSTTELSGYVGAMDANPNNGLIAVQVKVNDDASGCFGVVDPAVSLSEPIWETCNHSLGGFSPDGRLVMASSPYQSGIGPTSIDVLDARTGELVAEFSQTRTTQIALVQPSWESPESIVAIALDGPMVAMVRLGVDGSLATIADPVEGDWATDLQYYFGSDRTSM